MMIIIIFITIFVEMRRRIYKNVAQSLLRRGENRRQEPASKPASPLSSSSPSSSSSSPSVWYHHHFHHEPLNQYWHYYVTGWSGGEDWCCNRTASDAWGGKITIGCFLIVNHHHNDHQHYHHEHDSHDSQPNYQVGVAESNVLPSLTSLTHLITNMTIIIIVTIDY